MRVVQILSAVAMLISGSLASAQQISVRDQVSVDVPSSLFGSGAPSAELKQEARRQAVDRAWRRYQAQNFSGARAQQALTLANTMRPLVDTEFCTFSFHEERFDKESRKFSLEVRGTCDQRRIDAEFQRLAGAPTASANSDAGTGTARPRGATVSFVFLARRAASVTQQVETSASVSTTGSESNADNQRNTRNGSQSTGAEEASVTQRSRIGTTEFDAQYKYEVEGTDDAMTAVASVLQTNRFRVARYPELVTTCPGPSLGDLSRRYAEMKVNTAWSPSDTKGMFEAARQCRVPYFAFGLMEVLKSQPSGINMTTVTVSLNVKVNDLSEAVPSECASVNSQYQASGRDRLEATKAALKIAAEQGTRELIDIVRQNCLN